MAKRLALAAAVLTCLMAPAAVNAVTIFGTFEGTVSTVDPPLSFVEPGDAVIVNFQFESDAEDAAADPNLGIYNGPFENGSFQVGSFFTDEGFGLSGINVYNDIFNGGDLYTVGGGAVPGGVFPAPGFIFDLIDSTANALSDDSLPTSISLDDFDIRRFLFEFFTPVEDDLFVTSRVEGNVTAISFVPEPTAGFLILAGVLGLGVAGRRRNRLH